EVWLRPLIYARDGETLVVWKLGRPASDVSTLPERNSSGLATDLWSRPSACHPHQHLVRAIEDWGWSSAWQGKRPAPHQAALTTQTWKVRGPAGPVRTRLLRRGLLALFVFGEHRARFRIAVQFAVKHGQ